MQPTTRVKSVYDRCSSTGRCREGVVCIKALGFLLVTHQTSSDHSSVATPPALLLQSSLFDFWIKKNSIQNFKMNQVMNILRHFLSRLRADHLCEIIINCRWSSSLWFSPWLLQLHNIPYLGVTRTGLVAFSASRVQSLILLALSTLLVSRLYLLLVIWILIRHWFNCLIRLWERIGSRYGLG